MLAVSYPPITTIDGLRISHASVTGQNVCHEANHPNTTSLRATARTSAGRFTTGLCWRQSCTIHRSDRTDLSMATKLDSRP